MSTIFDGAVKIEKLPLISRKPKCNNPSNPKGSDAKDQVEELLPLGFFDTVNPNYG